MHFPNATSSCELKNTDRGALVIVDDEPFFRECLAEAIRNAFPDTPVIGLSARDEMHHYGTTAVALVLLRMQACPITGQQIVGEARALHQQWPNAPIVVLSLGANPAAIEEAIALGIRGIIPATTSFKVAVAALHLVMVGGTYYPCLSAGRTQTMSILDEPPLSMMRAPDLPAAQSVARPFLTLVEQSEEIFDAHSGGSNVIFTAREMEVLEALQKGWSNKWIAHSLHISENTIKVHIQRIMRKLHATNRTEAVVRHRQLNGLG